MSVSPAAADHLLRSYAPPAGAFDEAFARVGELRPHWQRFFEVVQGLGNQEFERRWQQAQREVRENGIAYSAFGDPQETRRPWKLDPLPLLIEADPWSQVEAGLKQRAALLDLILADLYGPQRILQEGHLPPEILFCHPGFRPSFHGQQLAQKRFLHFYAADLCRSADGQWRVLADRSDAPSGAGFALENRLVVSRMLPEAFRICQVQRLAAYFLSVQELLRNLAPQHRDNPHVVLLTQGTESPNYFQDAFLARYLGYTLVEGGDLTVRNHRVFLKTLGSLLPVDVIFRRPNGLDCDPLELGGHSPHGVAGLLAAVRKQTVAVANALGSGLVESPAFMAFLPRLSEALLGESLRLPGVATWWCGESDSLQYVLDHLDELEVRRAFRRRGSDLEANQELSLLTRQELVNRLRSSPQDYVGQERISGSSAPTWDGVEQKPARIALRAFLVADAESYRVLSGGLTRASSSDESLDISILSGEGSKDAWILSEGPVELLSLLPSKGATIELRRTGAELPSRVADNLYWLGRHVERAEGSARLLRTIVTRLAGEIDATESHEVSSLLRVLAARGQIEPGFVIEGIRDQLPEIETALPDSVFDESQAGSLRCVLNDVFRLASHVRDRISVDAWRIVHRMDQQFRPPPARRCELFELIHRTNELIIDLSAFSGMAMESMTRTQAFRFLDFGRRLERALQLINLLRNCVLHTADVPNSLLEAALEVADSLMTYRSRYLANLQLSAVMDLLLTDETNPRSLVFQLVTIASHIDQLPRDATKPGYTNEQRIAMKLLHAIRALDIQTMCDSFSRGEREQLDALLADLQSRLPQLSEAVSHRYLVHAGPPQQLTEIFPGGNW